MSRDITRVPPAPDERGDTWRGGFLKRVAAHFGALGVQTERVVPDRAKNYVVSKDFQAALAEIGPANRPTRPYRPQTTGKAEPSTTLEEWAYYRPYRSNEARPAALRTWLDTYNRRRPHTALGGLPAISRLPTT
jgi:Integrase core domain